MVARLGVLIVPAGMAVTAGLAGAGGSLLVRHGVITVTAGAVAGALAAEELDLHLLHLHSRIGLAAGLAIHAPGLLFLVGGLLWRSKLSRTEIDLTSCACEEANAACVPVSV